MNIGVPPAAPRPSLGDDEVTPQASDSIGEASLSGGYRGWGVFGSGLQSDALGAKMLTMTDAFPDAIETTAAPDANETSVVPVDPYVTRVGEHISDLPVILGPNLDELMENETPEHRKKMDEVITKVAITAFAMAKVFLEQDVTNPATDNQGIGE